MATFSENQVRHFYVINAAGDVTVAGDKLVIDKMPTDAVAKECVIYAKKTVAADLKPKLKKIVVTVAKAAAADYVLRIEYSQFIAPSDESFYHEFASYKATATDTVNTIAAGLAANLQKNTKKQGMVKVTTSGATITIEAVEQEGWVRGVNAPAAANFTVSASPLEDDTVWATIAAPTYTAIAKNGKVVADMEYFFLGERGDIYRGIGWPNVIQSEYRVDENADYDIYDIHYAYVGENHSVQKSEKTLTIAVKSTLTMPDALKTWLTARGVTLAS